MTEKPRNETRRETERDRERQRERQRERDRDRDRDTERAVHFLAPVFGTRFQYLPALLTVVFALIRSS